MGEQRANGAVDNAAGQHGLFAGAAFTAHKAAGNAAHCIHFFLKLNAQGEEINAVAGFCTHHNIAQHAGFAVADHGAAVAEAAHFTGFHHQRAAGQSGFKRAELGESFLFGREFQSHNEPPLSFLKTGLCTMASSNKSNAQALPLRRSIYC